MNDVAADEEKELVIVGRSIAQPRGQRGGNPIMVNGTAH